MTATTDRPTRVLPDPCRQCGAPIRRPLSARGKPPAYCSAECRTAGRTAARREQRGYAAARAEFDAAEERFSGAARPHNVETYPERPGTLPAPYSGSLLPADVAAADLDTDALTYAGTTGDWLPRDIRRRAARDPAALWLAEHHGLTLPGPDTDDGCTSPDIGPVLGVRDN